MMRALQCYCSSALASRKCMVHDNVNVNPNVDVDDFDIDDTT